MATQNVSPVLPSQFVFVCKNAHDVRLFGPECDAQASTIYFCVKELVAMFQMINKEQLAHLFRSILIDPGSYFSTPQDQMGNPPASRLDWLASAIRSGSLPTTMGVPLLVSMFGNARSGPRNPLATSGSQNGNQEHGRQAGGSCANFQGHAKTAKATAHAL